MAYCDTDDVAAYLRTTITSGTTPSSDTVDSWIDWAKDEIDNTVKHSYETETASDKVFETGSSKEFWIPKDFCIFMT